MGNLKKVKNKKSLNTTKMSLQFEEAKVDTDARLNIAEARHEEGRFVVE